MNIAEQRRSETEKYADRQQNFFDDFGFQIYVRSPYGIEQVVVQNDERRESTCYTQALQEGNRRCPFFREKHQYKRLGDNDKENHYGENKKGNRADILPEDAYHAFGFVIDCRKHGKSDAAENRGDKR